MEYVGVALCLKFRFILISQSLDPLCALIDIKKDHVLLWNLWIGCCGCLDSPCPSVLAVLQKLGPLGALSDGSRGAGNNPPAFVGTTLPSYCLCGAPFGALADGLFALRGSESRCLFVGQHGFVSVFLYSHFLKQLPHDYLHEK